jgi:hypothetical protein
MNEHNHQIGDGPIDPAYREKMNQLARMLDGFFNGPVGGTKLTGFVLMIFPFGDDSGRCNYISNAERPDVVRMLKEQLRHFEEDKP